MTEPISFEDNRRPISVLDKIRAEIEQMNNIDYVEPVTVEEVLQIIDKYRGQDPKTGHWIDRGKHIECDKCKTWFLKDHLIRKSFCPNCGAKMIEPQESDHKCHTCKHYTSGEYDGSCGSYICKGYSNWESEEGVR